MCFIGDGLLSSHGVKLTVPSLINQLLIADQCQFSTSLSVLKF